MDRIITDNSKVNENLLKENETLKNLLEIERQQVKRLAEQLNLCGVSNRRELLIDFAEKVYRRIYFTWSKKTSEKVVDEYIKGNL